MFFIFELFLFSDAESIQRIYWTLIKMEISPGYHQILMQTEVTVSVFRLQSLFLNDHIVEWKNMQP